MNRVITLLLIIAILVPTISASAHPGSPEKPAVFLPMISSSPTAYAYSTGYDSYYIAGNTVVIYYWLASSCYKPLVHSIMSNGVAYITVSQVLDPGKTYCTMVSFPLTLWVTFEQPVKKVVLKFS